MIFKRSLNPVTLQIVYFNSRDKLIRLDIEMIVFFEGDGNYTYIVTANKQKVCITMNLSHTEEALAAQLGGSAKQFMRIRQVPLMEDSDFPYIYITEF